VTTGKKQTMEVAPPSSAQKREKALQALTGRGAPRAPRAPPRAMWTEFQPHVPPDGDRMTKNEIAEQLTKFKLESAKFSR
jgi:hypothetical protein